MKTHYRTLQAGSADWTYQVEVVVKEVWADKGVAYVYTGLDIEVVDEWYMDNGVEISKDEVPHLHHLLLESELRGKLAKLRNDIERQIEYGVDSKQ